MPENLRETIERDQAVIADPNASLKEKQAAHMDLIISRRLLTKGVRILEDGPVLDQTTWIEERLSFDPTVDTPDSKDRTTVLAYHWQSLQDELKEARARTFTYASLSLEGELVIHDSVGLKNEWLEIYDLEDRVSEAEQAIRRIIKAGGAYFHKLKDMDQIKLYTDAFEAAGLYFE